MARKYASLSENCSLLGKGNVRGQISELTIPQIFSLARDWTKRITGLNISQLKLGKIRAVFPNFQTCACCARHLKDNKQINRIGTLPTYESSGEDDAYLKMRIYFTGNFAVIWNYPVSVGIKTCPVCFECVHFQREVRNTSRCCSCCQENLVNRSFDVGLRRTAKNVQRTILKYTAIVFLIKPFVW